MHATPQSPPASPILLDGRSLTIDDVVSVARLGRGVVLAPGAVQAMARSRAAVEACLSDGQAHYGINTGFGSLSRSRVAPDQLRELQRNLIRSHAAGLGEGLPTEVVRAMMLLLAASLSRGLSGVRAQVVQLLIDMLGRGVTPVVPSIGSVGASGDLAPLAAIGMAMIGEGKANLNPPAASLRSNESTQNAAIPAAEALARCGLTPISLEAKEGLAIINGTHLMASLGAMLCHDARVLQRAAAVACAMSIDAARASHAFLNPKVHAARNQPGQQGVAAELRSLLHGSAIAASHVENDPRVQDPYCLRCAPQVLGASRDALAYVTTAVSHELGAVTDNPLVFGAEEIVSAGNFHGMPLAIPLDAASIALAHVAGIAERRVFWLLAAHDPESHLPPYLARGAGLSSGLMIAQYVAAACCNEVITLCTPASVSNISTSAGIEDYNSFGPRAGMKALRALELARNVVAIELLCASEGLEFHRPLRSGEGVEQAAATVRSLVPRLDKDRPPAPDIEAIARAIRDGAFGA